MTSFSDRPRAVAFGLLLLFAAIEFVLRAPLLLGATALYQRDLFLLYFPFVQAVLRGLSEGALPLRDPTSAFGQPVLGDPGGQVLYPPVLLHLLLPPHQAYAWFVSIHSVFGALGVALLARRFSSGSSLAALCGGLAWLFCGPLQSLAILWHHMSGAAWIPWVLLAVIRVTEERSTRSAILLGAVFGGQILAGSADMCAMTALLCLLFVNPRDYLRLRWVWLGAVGIALGLSAGVWLPAGEMVLNSARSALPEATRTYWSLHPLALIELFLPLPLSALPFLPEWQAAVFEGREPFLGSVFLGPALLPLCLAALADPTVRRTFRLGSLVGALGGLLIALGKNAPFYFWAVALLPPLRVLRYPSKAIVPVTVLLCVLAGVGAASISRSPRARSAARVGILALAAVALALAGPLLFPFARVFLDPKHDALMAAFWRDLQWNLLASVALLGLLGACLRFRSGRVGGVLAVLLIVGHTWNSQSLHADFHGTVPAKVLDFKPEGLPLLRPANDGRIYVYDYGLFKGRAMKYLGTDQVTGGIGLKGVSSDVAMVISTRAYLAPLVGAFWGVDYAWDGDLRLLFDRRLAALTVDLRRVEGTPALLRLLQVSGVSRVLALHEAGFEGLTLVDRRKIYYRDDLRIFDVPQTRPRAFLTSGRTLRSGSDLRDLIAPGFDPARTVLVDDGEARAPTGSFEGAARVTARRADRLTVETSGNAPAFLTVLEGIMPGWRVWVDGRKARLERANAIFIGTEVPSGRHVVEFRFLPASAVVGVSLSGLFALGLFCFFLLDRTAAART